MEMLYRRHVTADAAATARSLGGSDPQVEKPSLVVVDGWVDVRPAIGGGTPFEHRQGCDRRSSPAHQIGDRAQARTQRGFRVQAWGRLAQGQTLDRPSQPVEGPGEVDGISNFPGKSGLRPLDRAWWLAGARRSRTPRRRAKPQE